MKLRIALSVLVFALIASLSACKKEEQGTMEKLGAKMDDTAHKMEDTAHDAGDAVKDAAEEVEEAVKEAANGD